MINHNLLLEDLLSNTLCHKFNNKLWSANFIEGDIFEVWKVLNDKKTKYPLIWLQSGYKVKDSTLSGNPIIRLENINLYLITLGSLNDFNNKRYKTTFGEFLYPIKDKLIKLLNTSKGIDIPLEYSYVTFPFNDMTELNNRTYNNGKNVSTQSLSITDVWDAIAIDLPYIQINTDCYQEYSIK